MLIDENESWYRLRGIVHTLTNDISLHEDLLQEGLVFLWQMEQQFPAKHRAWYFRRCWFQLSDSLRYGRSVDAMKRAHLRCQTEDDSADSETTGQSGFLAADDNVFDYVSARDLLNQLWIRLDPTNQNILALLYNGHTMRETAAHLHISHPAVIRRRQKIAELAVRLGVS